ncbi:hypothetical protein Athai_32130 [Actinocatenispora thailandica]|uniref:Uncharacterized protein n=1 Tax=Actinocatenispora thailandica TaxID=227318 RepID=A0A7R7DPV0_9ACTN|nr:hypothetical protein Athai_32130 [Actinocatenispora thailandica]
MSVIGSWRCQPDRVTAAVTSTGAPQRGHDTPVGSLECRQYRQV